METELEKLLKAFEKGQEGISDIIKSLNSNKKEIREFAYWLLKDIENPNLRIQQALKKFYPYPHFKYLYNLQQDSGFFFDIALSPNEKFIARGGSSQKVRVWNLEKKKLIYTFEHSATVDSVDFSPDNKLLVSASRDGVVKLWDLQTGNKIRTFQHYLKEDLKYLYYHCNHHKKPDSFRTVTFSLDGKKLITAGGSPDTIKIWNIETGKVIHILQNFQPPKYSADRVFAITNSPWGEIIAAGNYKLIEIWNINTGKLITTLNENLKEHLDEIENAIFTDNGTTLISASGEDACISVWNLETGELVSKFQAYDYIKDIALSPDRKVIAIARLQFNIILRNIETWSEIITLENTDYTHCLKFNADGTILFTRQDYPNYEIQAWGLFN